MKCVFWMKSAIKKIKQNQWKHWLQNRAEQSKTEQNQTEHRTENKSSDQWTHHGLGYLLAHHYFGTSTLCCLLCHIFFTLYFYSILFQIVIVNLTCGKWAMARLHTPLNEMTRKCAFVVATSAAHYFEFIVILWGWNVRSANAQCAQRAWPSYENQIGWNIHQKNKILWSHDRVRQSYWLYKYVCICENPVKFSASKFGVYLLDSSCDVLFEWSFLNLLMEKCHHRIPNGFRRSLARFG